MSIFALFRQSVYDPEFYKSLSTTPFKFSLKYFFSLILGIATALTVLFSISLVPAAQSFFVGLGPKIIEKFPSDLELKIQNGGVLTDLPQPYEVSFSKETEKETELKNLIVIDTLNPFTEERFTSYKTLLLLTRDSLVYEESKGVIKSQSLKGVPDFVINKSLAEQVASRAKTIARWISPFIVFAIFIFLFFSYVLNLAYLIIGALIVIFIGKFKDLDFTYKKAYQIGLQAISLNIFFSLLAWGGAPGLNFFAILLFAWIVWINLSPKENQIPPVETVPIQS